MSLDLQLNVSPAQIQYMDDYLNRKIKGLPTTLPTQTIVEHAEAQRRLPLGTPRPGPLDLNYTPYLIEPLQNMSPLSPVQRTIVIKGAQLGWTMAAESILCYYMSYSPADQLFVSATDDLLERWATRRLEAAIDTYDIRKDIYAQYTNKGSRRTGDKIMSKEYFGCRLDMASAQSAPSLRSTDKRVLVRDEVDGAPRFLKTGEGSWMEVSYVRTNAWGDRRKVFDFSTPTTFDESVIYPEYESSDQRKFFVKCPMCGKPQFLQFERLKPDKTAGTLVDAYYLCEFCNDAIFNHQKTKLLLSGKWKPTAETFDKTVRSYHCPSLLSPLGMLSWKEVWKAYEKAQKQPDGMRSFTNLYLGMPSKEIGARPDKNKVIELKGNYRSRTVPDGVLYLTLGMDVQAGSKKDKTNPARIEFEILGTGAGYRTWSITYEVIKGSISNEYQGAFEEFYQWVIKTGLKFKRSDGYEFPVSIIFIDSGDGFNSMDTVYKFCERLRNTFPIKGFRMIKRKKGEKVDKGDEVGPSDFRRYKYAKVGEDQMIYEISTNYYKNLIYNNLKIQRNPIGSQRPGFCDFPGDYGMKYFDMLTAEEKRTDGSFHSSGRPNESLDCRVYSQCAADVWIDKQVKMARDNAKKNGASDVDILKISKRTIIKLLENKTRRRMPSG